jgi:DNA polymerase III delta prime subunit
MALQTKLQESEKLNQQYQDAQEYEKQGDEKANQKKYKEALPLYGMGRKTYIELKMNDEVNRLDKKIVETKKKRKWYKPFD